MSLDEIRETLTLSVDTLKAVSEDFVAEMVKGLQEGSGRLLMIPTMVDLLPDGHETGEYWAVDFGGAVLHLLYTKLAADNKCVETVEFEQYDIPESVRHCPFTEVFDFVVDRMCEFAGSIHRSLREDSIVVGFSFSFPIKQGSIASGTLIEQGKGFANPGAIGSDPVALLTAAFRRQDIQATIPTLVNDTVGCLAGARYADGADANVAIIMGSGVNACYVEQLSNIGKQVREERDRGFHIPRTQDMIINIEMPGFRPQIPLLQEDRDLDDGSSHPGEHTLEKLTAGRYLGDVVRRILLRLGREQGWYPQNAPPERLAQPGALDTGYMADIVGDDSPECSACQTVLEQQFGPSFNSNDVDVRLQVREVCWLVARRSAFLIAACLCAVLAHLQRGTLQRSTAQEQKQPRNVVTAHGRMLQAWEEYRILLLEGVRAVLGEDAAENFELRVPEGGAGFGAACIAAAAHNYIQRPDSKPAPVRKFPPRASRSRTVSDN